MLYLTPVSNAHHCMVINFVEAFSDSVCLGLQLCFFPLLWVSVFFLSTLHSLTDDSKCNSMTEYWKQSPLGWSTDFMMLPWHAPWQASDTSSLLSPCQLLSCRSHRISVLHSQSHNPIFHFFHVLGNGLFWLVWHAQPSVVHRHLMVLPAILSLRCFIQFQPSGSKTASLLSDYTHFLHLCGARFLASL